MKKFFLVASLLVMCSMVHAQQRGDMNVSFDLGLSIEGGNTTVGALGSSTTTETKSPLKTGFSLDAGYHYFVIDNLSLGLTLGYNFSNIKTTDDNVSLSNSENSFIPALEASYYVPVAGDFYYTPGLSFCGLFSRVSFETDPSEFYKTNVSGVGIALHLVAFEYHPTEHFAINFGCGHFVYQHLSFKEKELDIKANSNTFKFSLLNNAYVGCRYYF